MVQALEMLKSSAQRGWSTAVGEGVEGAAYQEAGNVGGRLIWKGVWAYRGYHLTDGRWWGTTGGL